MNQYTNLWRGFKQAFLHDAKQQPIYLSTRHHIGSYAALLMSIYNLFHLRQKIIKNAIYITKSNNQKIVKSASLFIGCFYFLGLYSLWHIPSIGAQIAVRVYSASQVATTNLLSQQSKQNMLLGNKIKNILKKEGLKL